MRDPQAQDARPRSGDQVRLTRGRLMWAGQRGRGKVPPRSWRIDHEQSPGAGRRRSLSLTSRSSPYGGNQKTGAGTSSPRASGVGRAQRKQAPRPAPTSVITPISRRMIETTITRCSSSAGVRPPAAFSSSRASSTSSAADELQLLRDKRHRQRQQRVEVEEAARWLACPAAASTPPSDRVDARASPGRRAAATRTARLGCAAERPAPTDAEQVRHERSAPPTTMCAFTSAASAPAIPPRVAPRASSRIATM